MFDWYKNKRLNEQLKFFGGKRTGFVSYYSKKYEIKPRIRIKNKKPLVINPRCDIESSYQQVQLQQIAIADAQSQQGVGIYQQSGGMGIDLCVATLIGGLIGLGQVDGIRQ